MRTRSAERWPDCLLVFALAGSPLLAGETSTEPWSRTEPCRLELDDSIDWSCKDSLRGLVQPPQAVKTASLPSWTTLAPGASGGGATTTTKPIPKWAAGPANRWTWTATGLIGAGWAVLELEDDAKTIANIGDVTQLVPPALGLGMTLGARDWQGLKQYGWAALTSFGVVHLSKEVNEKYRPDATDTRSFPSGHTAASFFGAAYIQQRYGPRWGIPSLVLAGFTGYSRVKAQKHFTDDVISGMAVGLFTNFLFTKPIDPDRAAKAADMERVRRFRFEWENMDGNVRTNTVQIPDGEGTRVDFQFLEESDPQITASVAFDVAVTKRHHVKLRYTPFEIRDVGVLPEETSIGGVVLPAGQQVYSTYFLGDLRGRYAWRFFPDKKFILEAGGGLTYIDTTLELFQASFTEDSLSINEDSGVGTGARGMVPILYVKIGFEFAKRFSLFAEADGYDHTDDRFLDATAKFLWHINPKWDVAIGWRSVRSDLDIDRLGNEFERTGGLIHLAYSF